MIVTAAHIKSKNWDVNYYLFYQRDAMLARVFATATCLSVCLSVRPSVTRRLCA